MDDDLRNNYFVKINDKNGRYYAAELVNCLSACLSACLSVYVLRFVCVCVCARACAYAQNTGTEQNLYICALSLFSLTP